MTAAARTRAKRAVSQLTVLLRDGEVTAAEAADLLVDAVGPVRGSEFKDALDAAAERQAAYSRTPPRAAVAAERGGDPWGKPPSEAEVAAAAGRAERERAAALAADVEDSLTREQAAERLGITPQSVSERRKTGRLVGLRRGREWRFPRWQFSDDDALPGLRELAAAYPGSTLSLSVWAKRPHVDLDGRTPSEELARRGGPGRVLALVEAISAAAW